MLDIVRHIATMSDMTKPLTLADVARMAERRTAARVKKVHAQAAKMAAERIAAGGKPWTPGTPAPAAPVAWWNK